MFTRVSARALIKERKLQKTLDTTHEEAKTHKKGFNTAHTKVGNLTDALMVSINHMYC